MRGIILAGGKGTRLSPITKVVSKQLLPIYDKPMIYYPLSILLLLDIREILVISSKEHMTMFKDLLGDGGKLGICLQYQVQLEPKGIAESFILGKEFIGNESVCLVLGDNLFYGQDFHKFIQPKLDNLLGALIFGYRVKNPSEFGVVEFDKDLNVLSIEEKPLKPKSKYAVPGLYFYDNSVVEKAELLTPSERGELEITSLNQLYLREGNLRVQLIGRGTAWLDTGSPDALLSASTFVEVIQKRQGLSIACIEEIVWRKGYISIKQLTQFASDYRNTEYGNYIESIVNKELGET
jgi:glucose-1-phosphate thymidylyltransferase